MHEISANQARLHAIPSRHCACAAHGLEGVEESAPGARGDLALNINQVRKRRWRGDFTALVFDSAIHGAH